MQYSNEESIPINLIRQYLFCPRIPWFKYNLSIQPPEQSWMKAGEKYHNSQKTEYKRRFLNLIVEPYEKILNFQVESSILGIHGIVDEIIKNEIEFLVVEYKLDSRKPFKGQIFQALGYLYAAEETLKLKGKGAILIKGSAHKPYVINNTDILKVEFIKVLNNLKASLKRDSIPFSSADSNKCGQCEYLRHCNDR
jgi:CRISPR-associated exonuclease Cas4